MRGAASNGSAVRSRRDSSAANSATSCALAAKNPVVSIDQEKVFMPVVGNSRKLGLKPAMPQNDAGRMTEPPVCVPTAAGIMPAAIAAADPDEEPPGVCAGSCGLTVVVGCRKASSVVAVLPMMWAPRARAMATIGASDGGR